MKDLKTYSPITLEEALDIRANYRNDIAILAGGTDIVVYLKDKLRRPKAIMNLSKIQDFRCIEEDGKVIKIRPLVTHDEAVRSKLLNRYAPVLVEGCRVLGSPQIRNIATIGGNIVNASPVADTVPPLFVLGAKLKLQSKGSERWVNIEDYGTGPGITIMNDDELLTEISIAKMGNDDKGFFTKIGQRKALYIAKASVAFRANLRNAILSDVKVALGAVAPKVIFAPKTADYLEGKTISDETIEKARSFVETEATPITDLRSTEEYRRTIVGILLERGLLQIK